jgi:hypothetical protein
MNRSKLKQAAEPLSHIAALPLVSHVTAQDELYPNRMLVLCLRIDANKPRYPRVLYTYERDYVNFELRCSGWRLAASVVRNEARAKAPPAKTK